MNPTPQAQLTVCVHYHRKNNYLISTTGYDKDAKWIPGSQCSVFYINRTTAIVTMPEWLAVKQKLIPMGVLESKDDTFRDTPADG